MKNVELANKKQFITWLCIVMLLASGQSLTAQEETRKPETFSRFHVGGVFPSGKFGNGNERSDGIHGGKGFASTGLTVGYRLYNSLSMENLSWVFGIEAYYNGLNSDYKDEIEKSSWKDITFPKYLNLPVTVGLNYAIPLSDGAKLYGEAAVGANLSVITNYSLGDRSGYQDMEHKVTPAVGFAYGLEGGIFINQKYSIGVRYNHLGSYKYKYETHYEDGDQKKNKYDRALPITGITLSVGFLF